MAESFVDVFFTKDNHISHRDTPTLLNSLVLRTLTYSKVIQQLLQLIFRLMACYSVMK